MRELHNLIVDLDERFDHDASDADAPFGSHDERALAWIDATFGGWWSSEAYGAPTLIAYRQSAPAGFVCFDRRERDFAWLRGLAREPGVGIFGPIGVAPSQRGGGLGRSLIALGLCALRARGYTRALIPAVGDARLVRYYAELTGARLAESWSPATLPRARTVALVSGNGTNLQALLDRTQEGSLPLDIAAVVSSTAEAYALERARRANVPTRAVVWDRARETRAAYDARLLEAVRAEEPALVVLLGWMHLLAPAFVTQFPALLNVHPAYLPLEPARDDVVFPDGTATAAFRGAHAIRDALRAGVGWVGASVHAVTAATDRGRILARRPLPIAPGEEPKQVLARLHPIEHELVAAAVRRWLFERE